MNCPECNSTDTLFSKKKQTYICEDCDHRWSAAKEFIAMRIFISYGHDEYIPFARQLAKELKERKHEVWFDEERLKPGGDWELYIEEGLDWISEARQNARMLLIMTPYSIRRPDGYCLNEIARALDNRLKIVPVMLVWATPPLSMCRLQYLDLQNSNNKRTITETFVNDFEKIYKALEDSKYLDNEGSTSQLVYQLEPLDFSADLILNQTYFTGRKWVFKEIEEWLKDENASRLFWITGVPGIGKTAIATQLIQKYPFISAFHICKKGHSEKASPQRTVCTLAYQLSTQLPDYRDILSGIDIKKELDRCNEVALFDVLIAQPLNHEIKHPGHTMVILIDGLDEASHDGKNEIARFIASEFEKLPQWLRIIITSRPDNEVLMPLQAFNPWVLASQSDKNQTDIDEYIDKRLGAFKSKDLYGQVKDTLIKNAEGVFLYIKHVCDEIDKGRLQFEKPNQFPKGLGSIFQQYFENKFPDKQYYRQSIRPALQLIAAAYSPLNQDEINDVLGWNSDDFYDFKQDIGSFIIENSENKVVPFHASLFDWLEDETKAGLYWINSKVGDMLFSTKGSDLKNEKYFISFMPKHYIRAEENEKFIHLFNDRDFISNRQLQLSTYEFFLHYFTELKEFYDSTNIDLISKIYSNEVFQSILLEFRSYLFDMQYYANLKNSGFSEFLELNKNLSLEFKKSLMSYYYINLDYNKVASNPIVDYTDMEVSNLKGELLDKYGSSFNLIGVCNRIIGNLSKAAIYLEKSIEWAENSNDLHTASVVRGNLARVESLSLNIEKAEVILLKGIDLINEIKNDHKESLDQFKELHLHNGCTYILAELYLNLKRPDKAKEKLDIIGSFYENPQNIDRYWERYLYTLAWYAVQKMDIAQARKYLDMITESQDDSSNAIKLPYFQAIFYWFSSIMEDDKSMLNLALEKSKEARRLLYENNNIEFYTEAEVLYDILCNRCNQKAEESFCDLSNFEPWMKLKFDLFISLESEYMKSKQSFKA